MQLTSENDKMKMIDVAVNPINEFIKSFFNELESNKKNDDNDIGKNTLNINGSWGSGKSTIVNNLEYYYQSENKKEKPNFFIFNLWEYETLSEPFFYLVKDLLNKIFLNISNDYVKQKEEVIKKVKKWTIGLTFKLPFLDIKIENEQKKEINVNSSEIQKILDNTNDLKQLHETILKEINNQTKNEKLYIEKNKEEYESKYKIENYTDKLFNSVFDLDIHFDPENLTFIENEYIKQFLKEMNIKNPRLFKKIIENTESIILKMNNNDKKNYLWIKKDSKQIINKMELVIFYIYYLKFCKEKEYKNIFKFSNEIKIFNTDFFKTVKKIIFEKIEKNKSSLSNKNIFIWIFIRNKFNLDIDTPISFNFTKLQRRINGLELNCVCFTFQFLIPFFWNSLNISNIDNIFNKNLIIENNKNGFYSDKKYEVGIDLKDLILEKNQEVFLNILTTNFYENNKNLICDCFNNKKVNLSYENFQQIIEWTVFNSSWNKNLNINKELQEK